jgi:hypothetical protein
VVNNEKNICNTLTKRHKMATYTYHDSFLTDSLESDEIDRIELEAIEEVDNLKIENSDFKKRLIINRAYMKMALLQMENDEMKDKYNAYKAEYQNALTEITLYQSGRDGIINNNVPSNIALTRA